MKALALVIVAACGTPHASWATDADSDCAEYEVPAGTNLMAPTETFQADVMPILSAHCSSASCHGVVANPPGGLSFGDEKQGLQAADVYTTLMTMSGELTTMPYITPMQPSDSFLMHKLDADLCSLASMCTGGNCQHSMPLDVALTTDDRDTVRRWIAQGALNN